MDGTAVGSQKTQTRLVAVVLIHVSKDILPGAACVVRAQRVVQHTWRNSCRDCYISPVQKVSRACTWHQKVFGPDPMTRLGDVFFHWLQLLGLDRVAYLSHMRAAFRWRAAFVS